MQRICIIPRVDGIGGTASFRLKFEQGLRARGVEVMHDLSAPADAVLVIGGTRGLLSLRQARRRGTRVVQRLDGINWVHRKRRTGLRHYIRAEYGNFILSLIRSRLADGIIYQSEFSRSWWEEWYGRTRIPSTIIHNGIDLSAYTSAERVPSPPYRLLLVEGSLGGGYDMGLDNAIQLAGTLQDQHAMPMELVVVGRITEEHKARVSAASRVPIQWMGAIPREQVPHIMRSAHLFFSADLHPACPNSVIEALACGLPVAAFDTGAVGELVTANAGRVVPYGSNSWNIETPDIPALARAAHEILSQQESFRSAARTRAESALGLDAMTDAYLHFLLES